MAPPDSYPIQRWRGPRSGCRGIAWPALAPGRSDPTSGSQRWDSLPLLAKDPGEQVAHKQRADTGARGVILGAE